MLRPQRVFFFHAHCYFDHTNQDTLQRATAFRFAPSIIYFINFNKLTNKLKFIK
jgi:aromatic ring-cleaving dioxygenase